ncbi:MAG: MBL fold metallo-hydrolase [Devosiaceae bacterium]|nr:MBL fold metallo-hydrolase [Devosiaceae bacterium MH13]
MEITLIRNATVRITTPSATILMDPWLMPKGANGSFGKGPDTSPLVDLPLSVEEVLDGVDAVLVTHLHPDHFCDMARDRLPKNLPILCPQPHAPALRDMGFADVRETDQPVHLDGLTITETPAEHGPPEMLERTGPARGYLIDHPGSQRVYFAGDTVLTDDVRTVLTDMEPDAVFLNAGGALSKGRFGPIIMTAPEVVAVGRAAPDATLFPIHLDTTDHATVTRDSLRGYVDAFAPTLAPRLTLLADGQTVDLHS